MNEQAAQQVLNAPNPVPVPAQLNNDIVNALAIGKRFMDAEKAGGPAAIAKEFNLELPQIEQVAGDVLAAVPAIKAGWKTTEFWMMVGLLVVNAISVIKTGKPLTLDANVSLGGMAAAYAGSRAYTKANAPTATSSTLQSIETKTTSSAPAVQIQAAKQ